MVANWYFVKSDLAFLESSGSENSGLAVRHFWHFLVSLAANFRANDYLQSDKCSSVRFLRTQCDNEYAMYFAI